MLNKKIYVCIFCLFFILSIQAISATDNTTNNELSTAYNIQKNNLETNVQYDDVSTENKDTKLSLDEQDKSSTDQKTNEDSLTFTDLNNTINGNSNSTINLSNNYKYNGDLDSELIDGISISRNLTIYGNGITIDGSGNARIFSLIDPNLTVSFYNINFINANAEFGGALVYGDAYNCIFTNNKATYGGGAIYQGKAFNCTFIGNSAFSAGAIYQGNAYNSTFINNTANEFGGALLEGTAVNCTFTDNNALSGQAMCEGTAILCRFYNNTCELTNIVHASINVLNYTSSYQSGEKLKFNLTVLHSLFDGFNTTIKIYNNGSLVKTVYAFTGEGWIVDLGVGEYTAVLSLTDYPDENSSNATINISKGNTTVVINPINDTIVGKEIIINYTTNSNGTVTIKVNGETVKDGKFTPTKGGTYNVTVDVAENDFYAAGSNQTTFEVGKIPTTVVIRPIIGPIVGKEIAINYDTNSNGTVTIKVNGETVKDGKFTPTKGGTYNVTVDVAENDFYAAGSNQTTFEVGKIPTTVVIRPIIGPIVGKEIAINYDTNSNGTVTIKVNGETVKDGKFTPTTADTYNLTVEVAENEYYTKATNQTTFTVGKATSKIIVNPVTTTYNVDKYLEITLKDENGHPIILAPLIVNFLDTPQIFLTNIKGQVKINVATLAPNTYSTIIIYLGSDDFKGSTSNVPVTIKKANPKITAKSAKFQVKVKNKYYTAVFKDNKNKVLKNTKVTLKVNGKTYTTKTNSKGQGIFKITNLKKKGTYTTIITIPANKYYNKVTKTVKISVNS